MKARYALSLLALLAACADEPAPTDEAPQSSDDLADELAIGAIDDLKSDGGWGPALECKPVPVVEPLVAPQIVVSLDGLTLHLTDEATGYDRVFPIGPGVIEDGASLTPTSEKAPGGVFYARLDMPSPTDNAKGGVPWAYSYSCRRWWTDPDTGKNIPVFAGLPFIRLEGAPTLGYALHGPIDSYTLPDGGKLRRGYVSHGCVRMQSADILEVYGRCLGSKVPVRVQREVERQPDGLAVDVEQRWILSECQTDADCNYAGGVCRSNPWTGRGWCTAACTKVCDYDKFGYPVSFCVADPEDDTLGVCTLKSDSLNNACKRYPGVVLSAGEPRFGDPAKTADVCLPGVDGWIGDPCFTDADCGLAQGTCAHDAGENEPGRCTIACKKYCPDAPGQPSTFCVTGPDGAGRCVAKCGAGGACETGTCTPGTPRHEQPSVTSSVCL